MTKDEALTLEALKYAASLGNGRIVREMNTAPFIIRCDEALEQPEQEPAAYQDTADKCRLETVPAKGGLLPQRPWVGLTDEEIKAMDAGLTSNSSFYAGALWAEAKLKEKNT